jgi:hypothetical protein
MRIFMATNPSNWKVLDSVSATARLLSFKDIGGLKRERLEAMMHMKTLGRPEIKKEEIVTEATEEQILELVNDEVISGQEGISGQTGNSKTSYTGETIHTDTGMLRFLRR